MCGISGVVSDQIDRALLDQVGRMVELQHHRGPDARGVWHDDRAALGHNRLSIIDLTDGSQPMSTQDGRFTIVFNGEIYNFKELRETLPRGTLRSASDTEVLLELFARRGPNALHSLNGMFSFAVWDRERRELVIARDRLGVKPLYYSLAGTRLYFSSELGALRAVLGPQPIDRAAVIGYLRASYVPGDRSIYRNVHKLQPGSFLRFRNGQLTTTRYWNPWQTEPDARMTQSAAEEELLSLLNDAIRLRMIADVPLGAFLSGGVDSSSIVAMMSEQSSKPVKTFTIGFQDQETTEIEHARNVAARYGTEHIERVLSAQSIPDALDSVLAQFGEPFGDASAVPTHLVSKVAREEVTVALSGDGGDEFHGGYGLYGYLHLLQRMRYLPRPLNRLLARGAQALPDAFGRLPDRAARFLDRALHPIPKQHWYHRDNFVNGSSHLLLNDDMKQWAAQNWLPHTYAYFEGLEHLSCADQAMRVDAQSYLID
ncbi:MAG: asparagine synthase (glutamine-hydrolyzing), partial [Pseudomonadota bacterium]